MPPCDVRTMDSYLPIVVILVEDGCFGCVGTMIPTHPRRQFFTTLSTGSHQSGAGGIIPFPRDILDAIAGWPPAQDRRDQMADHLVEGGGYFGGYAAEVTKCVEATDGWRRPDAKKLLPTSV